MAITTSVRVSLPWAKGVARFETGQIAMVVDAYSPKYSAHATQGIDVELAQVHTADDAVAFVERFGLLTKGVYWPKSTPVPGVETISDADIPVEDREPFDLFTETAEEFRTVLRVMKTLRQAMADDDRSEAARHELAEWAVRTWPRRPEFPDDEEKARIVSNTKAPDFLKGVSGRVAQMLTSGIDQDHGWRGPTRFAISGPQVPSDPREAADRIQLALMPATLRAFCYWTLAEKLITRAPIVECPGCGHDFIRAHRAQTFCTRNCTRRSRYRAAQDTSTGTVRRA